AKIKASTNFLKGRIDFALFFAFNFLVVKLFIHDSIYIIENLNAIFKASKSTWNYSYKLK
ncbi:MAG: hypothetical protein WCL34_10840, partial [Methylococcaceae bacterium]